MDVPFTNQRMELSRSPEGVSLRDETNSKSPGTSSGAWMHRLRTKGWNYHVALKG